MTAAPTRVMAYASMWSAELRALMHWWIAELKDLTGCLFGWATERAHRQFVLAIHDGICVFQSEDGQEPVAQVPLTGLDASNAADTLKNAGLPKRAQVRILLPAAEMLLCPLRLPFLRESDLSAALELQLERKLPLPSNLIYVDWRAERRGAGVPIDVTVGLVRRASIDKMMAAMRTLGWRVAGIDVQGHPGWTFLPRAGAAAHLSIQPRDRWLLAAMTMLVVALSATVAGQWAYERTSLGEELSLAREQQARAASQSRVVELEREPIVLLQRVMAAPDGVPVLQALTDVIPMDSWVYRTQIRAPVQGEGLLEISGYTPAPQVLVEALERHPVLERVELINAATGAGATGTSRVELRAYLPAISVTAGSPRASR